MFLLIKYLDSMGYNMTSTLYANSSGPRISTIRPTAAWSTPDVSLNPGFLEVDEVFLDVPLPVDDEVIRTGRAAVAEDTELLRVPESEDEHGGLMQSQQSGRHRTGWMLAM